MVVSDCSTGSKAAVHAVRLWAQQAAIYGVNRQSLCPSPLLLLCAAEESPESPPSQDDGEAGLGISAAGKQAHQHCRFRLSRVPVPGSLLHP